MEEPRQRIWGWKKPRGKSPKARKKLDIRQKNYTRATVVGNEEKW